MVSTWIERPLDRAMSGLRGDVPAAVARVAELVRLDQAGPKQDRGQLARAATVQLLASARKKGLDRPLSDLEPPGDVADAEPSGGQQRDFGFAPAKPMQSEARFRSGKGGPWKQRGRSLGGVSWRACPHE